MFACFICCTQLLNVSYWDTAYSTEVVGVWIVIMVERTFIIMFDSTKITFHFMITSGNHQPHLCGNFVPLLQPLLPFPTSTLLTVSSMPSTSAAPLAPQPPIAIPRQAPLASSSSPISSTQAAPHHLMVTRYHDDTPRLCDICYPDLFELNFLLLLMSQLAMLRLFIFLNGDRL